MSEEGLPEYDLMTWRDTWEELKRRVQSAFLVLSGDHVAVERRQLEQYLFSHSIVQDDLDYAREREIEREIAELPDEDRTPEKIQQIADSVNTRWGFEAEDRQCAEEIDIER